MAPHQSSSTAAEASSSTPSPERSRLHRVIPAIPAIPTAKQKSHQLQDQQHQQQSPLGQEGQGRNDKHGLSCAASKAPPKNAGSVESDSLAPSEVVLLQQQEIEYEQPQPQPQLGSSLNFVWTPELRWERQYLLQLFQADTVDSRQIMARIRDFPEVLIPVPLGSDREGLHGCPTLIDTIHTTRYQFPRPHQETRKSRAVRVRGEPLRGKLVSSQTSTSTSAHLPELYEQTVLGAMCSYDMTLRRDEVASDGDDDERHSIRDVIRAVLNQQPDQVRCSQRISGHTPLRDAVCNPTYSKCWSKRIQILSTFEIKMA